MRGHFDLALMDACGLKDEDFEKARQDGTIEELLAGLPVKRKVRTDNLVHDNFAAYCFNRNMSGPDITDPFDFVGAGDWSALGFMSLQTTDDEPGYTDLDYDQSIGIQSAGAPAAAASTGAKRFVDDAILAPEIVVDPNGREAVISTHKFLWTPLQGVSSNIRSPTVFFDERNSDTVGACRRASIARVRLKDSAGNPTILTKNSNEVLLVEYTFTLVSV